MCGCGSVFPARKGARSRSPPRSLLLRRGTSGVRSGLATPRLSLFALLSARHSRIKSTTRSSRSGRLGKTSTDAPTGCAGYAGYAVAFVFTRPASRNARSDVPETSITRASVRHLFSFAATRSGTRAVHASFNGSYAYDAVVPFVFPSGSSNPSSTKGSTRTRAFQAPAPTKLRASDPPQATSIAFFCSAEKKAAASVSFAAYGSCGNPMYACRNALAANLPSLPMPPWSLNASYQSHSLPTGMYRWQCDAPATATPTRGAFVAASPSSTRPSKPPIPSSAPATSNIGTFIRFALPSNCVRAKSKSPMVGASATTARVAPGHVCSAASAA